MQKGFFRIPRKLCELLILNWKSLCMHVLAACYRVYSKRPFSSRALLFYFASLHSSNPHVQAISLKEGQTLNVSDYTHGSCKPRFMICFHWSKAILFFFFVFRFFTNSHKKFLQNTRNNPSQVVSSRDRADLTVVGLRVAFNPLNVCLFITLMRPNWI